MFVISGGGSGLGKALALALAEREKSVLIVGRREALLQDAAAQSPLISYLVADVSAIDGRELLRKRLELLPRISALINNAGTLEPLVSLQTMPADAWHHALNTNLDAALFLPQMLYDKLTYGRVLNIGSGAAYFALKGWAAYCVSKAALAMLTQCWQLESSSVAFASVMPGIVDTQMQAIARSGQNIDTERAQFYQRLKEHNRLISPQTVAAFFTWLLLDVDKETYVAQEWDIYDTSHHAAWLKPPHQVLHWDF